MKFRKLLLLLLIFSLLAVSGCASGRGEGSDNRPVIAVTILPEVEIVEKICGLEYNVIAVVPAGASPETYEPTPEQMVKLSKAKLYFAIGVPAETAILPTLSADTDVIKLQENIADVYVDRLEDGGRDPHIWLSPKRMLVAVEAIRVALSNLNPENSALYKQNAELYTKEIEALDEEILFMSKKAKGDKFLVFHPSFGYFAEDYGLQMLALEEHGKEATAKHLTEMADLAKSLKINTVFYQADAPSKQAEAFAEEIGASAVKLNPLAADYIENMRNIATEIFKAVK